jgi:hypothetical protein
MTQITSRLRVFWWAENKQGGWVKVSHAPVALPRTDAADLRLLLDQFCPTDKWERVVATKQDLGIRVILHERHGHIDFDAELACFCKQLRDHGRSRCELELHELHTNSEPS